MRKEILGRIIYDTALLVSVLFLPFWASMIFVCVGVVIYEQYLECVIAGVVIDLLYGTYVAHILFTAMFFCVYIVFGRIKKHIRIYG